MPGGGARHPATHETVDQRHALRQDEGQRGLQGRGADVRGLRRADPRRATASPPTTSTLFVPHQANLRIIEAAVKRLNLPMERVIVNVDRYGNTGAASVYVALEEAMAAGRLQRRAISCSSPPSAAASPGAPRLRCRGVERHPSRARVKRRLPRFPGQGSQAVGMGRRLRRDLAGAASACGEEADDALGFSLSRLFFEGPEADLALTANTQPAVLTASVAAAAACAERGLAPDARRRPQPRRVLRARGRRRAPLRDAVRLVRRRGEFMQEAVPVGTGRDGRALMGVEAGRRPRSVCAEAAQGEVVGVANLNSPGADRDRRPSVGGGARGGAAAARGGTQERAAAGERALSLRAHEAGRRPARRRAASASRSRAPRVPGGAQRRRRASPGRRTTSSRSSCARSRARCAGRTCVERLAREGADRVRRGRARAACSTGLAQAHARRRARARRWRIRRRLDKAVGGSAGRAA